MRREQDPFLGACDNSIPGGGAVGVFVEGGAGSGGAHDEPSMIWPLPLLQH